MKIKLITTGRTETAWIREGMDIYISRLKHYAPFSVIEIPELKNVSSLTKDMIKIKEGELILKNISPSDHVILLDERGKEYSSMEWASLLESKLFHIGGDLVFVIGGAYGFDSKVYDRCNGKLSLSRMTFSHQMVRVIFTEQLYRAFTIMKGEPYHHE